MLLVKEGAKARLFDVCLDTAIFAVGCCWIRQRESRPLPLRATSWRVTQQCLAQLGNLTTRPVLFGTSVEISVNKQRPDVL